MKVETFGIFLQLIKLMTSSILLGPKKCIVLRERQILTFFNYWTPFWPSTVLEPATGQRFCQLLTSKILLLREISLGAQEC